MQYRTGKELRELFLSFFESKGCRRLHSFSLTPDDPTLLFTIAGMVPFKPYFLGIKTPEFTRATTSQKCVRTNDIENVGHTARHHTFFEMLGNFSFGDYFKKEVIPWAYEFLTEYIGLEPERLYVTVHVTDDEAYEIWNKTVGIPADHIYRFDEDNFWASGPVGPCGPCSEILYDQGEEYSCGKPTCAPGCDCDRYLEIWNLVFMQFNRAEDGTLTPLPKKNIDTGMGLERLASVVQNVKTDFETDLFRPIIDETCKLVNVKYGEDPKKDLAVRVIADHIRASAFMISDGILPSNEGGGYVLRRLIRRCVRFGRLMGIDHAFLTGLLPVVAASIGDEYSELEEQKAFIRQVLELEESRFSKTLAQGSDLLDSAIEKVKADGHSILSGDTAFELYDTFGFPFELTEEICEEKGMTVDREGFDRAMEEQRERARSSSKQLENRILKTVYTKLADTLGATKFLGYGETKAESRVLAIVADGEEVETLVAGLEADVILEATPFYAQKGGQVGDKGTLVCDGMTFKVNDTTYPASELIVHSGKLISGELRKGQMVTAEIDVERRKDIQRHHTATHLLQEALTRVLGNHVRQAGSLVTPTMLRFDFNHFQPVTPEEIKEVEKIVYAEVLKNTPVVTMEMEIEEAKKTGARALFDEKYGDVVRVVDVKGFSTELCGGTHAKATGEIGLVKILREEGIGSGVRRITAVAGSETLPVVQSMSAALANLIELLGGDLESVGSKVGTLLDEKKILERKNKELQVKTAVSNIENTVKPRATANGVDLIVESFDGVTPDLMRQIGDRIRQKFPVSVIIIVGKGDEKALVTSMASDEAVAKGAHAGKTLQQFVSAMGGKGGGKPNLAQGGVASTEKLGYAVNALADVFEGLVK
ncbi:MAG: alanine--tRNA ligase [Synergistaceae bacterium]|nr:alanine--tRNA ligase [Synergistaceae bacterium]